MNEDLFPFINPIQDSTTINKSLPLIVEIARDFVTGDLLVNEETGQFMYVEGKEALKVWIYKAILTERYVYEIYDDDYGDEVKKLIGQGYTRGYSDAEATRYIKEALEINEYITEINKINATFQNDMLEVELAVNTIYGEVNMNVRTDDERISIRRNA